MRGWIVGACIAGVLVLLAWAGWRTEESAPTRERPSAARTRSERAGRIRTSAPQPPSRAGLSIRGTVVDPLGRPVSGARVSASWPEDGQTLSTLPCPWEGGSRPELLVETTRQYNVADCLPRTRDTVLSLLLAREGESPVHAETRSAEDGSFVLEGLPSGPQALLALSEQGAASRLGVPSGSEHVELVVEHHHRVSGQVLGEDDAPMAAVSILVVSHEQTRFFDTSTDAQGRFEVGPLLAGGHVVLATKEGWPAVLADPLYQDEPLTIRMSRPRALTGRVLSSGSPVKDVEVLATREDGDLPMKVRTDPEGRFTVELDPGTYVLTAERNGRYALTRVTVEKTSPPEVVMNLGEAFHVEGAVFGAARREPVVGAVVTVTAQLRPQRELKATTGADGRYRLGPVEPGPWSFTVEARGYIDLPYGKEVELGPGTGSQDFTLERAASISGRVVDEAGHPLAGIHLNLEQADLEDPVDYETQETALTDSNGAFVLDASAPGDYELIPQTHRFITERLKMTAPARDVLVTLRAGGAVEGTLSDARGLALPGFTVYVAPLSTQDPSYILTAQGPTSEGRFSRKGVPPGRYRIVAQAVTDGVDQEAATEVEVRQGEVTQVELRLAEQRNLEGIVVDGAGAPIRGAFVRAHSLAPSPQGGVVLVHPRHRHGPPNGVETGADGRFLIRGMGLEKHSLTVLHLAYELSPEQSTGAPLEDGLFVADVDVKQVRLVMKRHAHVRGRVVGPEGAPITGFNVDSIRVTSEDGTFSVPNREGPGITTFAFEAEGLLSELRDVKGGLDGPDIDLGEIRLGAGRRLRGVVVDARTGAPLPRANLEVHVDERTAVHSLTDEAGRFELGPVTTGTLTLLASQRGVYRQERVTVEAAQQEVTVRLKPGARMLLKAVDLRGGPLDGNVTVQGPEGYSDRVFLEKGRVEMGGLVPGRYLLKAEGARKKDQVLNYLPQAVEVPESGEVSVLLQPVTEGSTLTVRVSFHENTYLRLVHGTPPLPERPEELQRRMSLGQDARAEVDGTEQVFTFTHVPEGKATLFLMGPEDDRYHAEVLDVPASGTMPHLVRPVWRTFGVAARQP
ncbi:carboxypeptidase regulatory-like domain-containing protein [Myxococcus sp. K38C18041901]|uniref:carboxypeptidase regulatory-like domain-containing protein n=1 Tax=Myxococcus guangdongensis TaxID=2906760 RepID=UPI0020A7D49A|nr:carboxypeptidase regulatory-like domain-containing protein [Myxococcus guangdongensis]MCP3065677.1 carboxypeptidase regulatory-like domain-containing protein [Myxococcus guangdongensis]